MNGFGGDDTLLGLEGDDVLIGGSGNDVIDGGEHSDALIGGIGSDSLIGGLAADILHGSEGTDNLSGGDGNDLLSGGKGDDTLAGGNGSDYYVYQSGDGNDVIADSSGSLTGSSSTDTLYLNGIFVSGVEFTRYGSTLVITVKETHESITILNAFSASVSALQHIIFQDGTALTLVQINERLTIRGTDNRDLIRGSGVSETIVGGLGDDHLDGLGGSDTFEYSRGDGNDVIAESPLGVNNEINRLKFRNLNASDLYFSSVGYAIIITDRLNGQTITVTSQNINVGSYTRPIERFDFADGTSWTAQDLANNLSLLGTDFADTLSGSSNKEVIAAGLGNDYIVSNGGDDVFVYAAGHGDDVITLGSGNETIQFTNLVSTDLILTRIGYDVKVQFGSLSGSIILKGLTAPYPDQQVNGFEFADGTSWSMAEVQYWYSEGSSYYRGTDGLDTITGSYFDQTLEGAGGSDFIDGKGGRDQINGDFGDDTLAISIAEQNDVDVLNGGAGIDTATFSEFGYAVDVDLVVDGGRVVTSSLPSVSIGSTINIGTLISIENVIGSAFNDRLSGSLEANTIIASNGNDSVFARSGDDIIYGGNGNDFVHGGPGNDTIYGESGNDSLDGGLGNDVFIGGYGNDTYTIDVVTDMVTEDEGGGVDTIISSISYTLETEVENLTLTGSVQINGTGNTFNNIISGNISNNTLNGLGGNDTLDGGLGADTMVGGVGDDTYYVETALDLVTEAAESGADTIYSSITTAIAMNVESLILTGTAAINGTGLGANETIIGNVGLNLLYGPGGNDTLIGGDGGDHLYGGAGADAHDGGSDAKVDYARYDDANHGNLTIRLDLSSRNTGVAAGDSYIGIEGLVGGQGNDLIVGDAANNFLFGGGGGADSIFGLSGNDYINGGACADKFCFITDLNATTNVDTIADFVHLTDEIQLSTSIFASIGATLDASEFHLGTAAADGDDFIIYNSVNGQLFYDANGNVAGGQTLFATVTVGTVLDVSDFVLA